MSDRSEEASATTDANDADAESRTRSPAAVLEATDRLLGRSGSTGGGTDLDATAEGSSGRSWLPSFGTGTEADSSTASATRRRSRSVISWFSLSTYFSPTAYLALVAVLVVGILAGNLTLPVAGSVVGMFVVAVAVGTLDSRRWYAEMTAAGCSIGALSALADYTVPALADLTGSSVTVGVTFGLIACLVGYYFGRDLRNALRGAR